MPDELWFHSILACPDCKQDLQLTPTREFRCISCPFVIPVASPLHLMPINPQPAPFSFQPFSISDPEKRLASIDLTEPKDVYRGPSPADDPFPAALMSLIIAEHPSARRVLDLGAGAGGKSLGFEFLGCEYVGLDVYDPNPNPFGYPSVFGDAHWLPFRDQQFDVVFSYMVLEHLYNPFVALAEVRRVLKPNGIFVGGVAQGEPFHQSFFHHTAWGLLSLCDATGLQLTKLWSARDTLAALAVMGGYPKVVLKLLAALDVLHTKVPMLAPRRASWSEQRRRQILIHQAATLCFCMRPALA